MGSLKDLPDIDGELEVGDFVFVTFTVSTFEWRKGVTDAHPHGPPGSPQKRKWEGFTMGLSFNILDVVLIESAKSLQEEEPVAEEEEDDDAVELF